LRYGHEERWHDGWATRELSECRLFGVIPLEGGSISIRQSASRSALEYDTERDKYPSQHWLLHGKNDGQGSGRSTLRHL
jgi:hypothetical protein